MGNSNKLLINGSLVRAQQAEPYNQGLTETKDGQSVLNLEPGSKPPLFSPSLSLNPVGLIERIRYDGPTDLVLRSLQQDAQKIYEGAPIMFDEPTPEPTPDEKSDSQFIFKALIFIPIAVPIMAVIGYYLWAWIRP